MSDVLYLVDTGDRFDPRRARGVHGNHRNAGQREARASPRLPGATGTWNVPLNSEAAARRLPAFPPDLTTPERPSLRAVLLQMGLRMTILVQSCCYLTLAGFGLMGLANVAHGDYANAAGCALAVSVFTAAFHV